MTFHNLPSEHDLDKCGIVCFVVVKESGAADVGLSQAPISLFKKLVHSILFQFYDIPVIIQCIHWYKIKVIKCAWYMTLFTSIDAVIYYL